MFFGFVFVFVLLNNRSWLSSLGSVLSGHVLAFFPAHVAAETTPSAKVKTCNTIA